MIIRFEKKGNYTTIPNEILNNPNLSAKAKGILVQLLSKPDSWRLNVKYLVNTNKEGHYAVRAAIKELEDQNYIHRIVTREKGKITGTEYLICDRVTSRANAEALFCGSPCNENIDQYPDLGSGKEQAHQENEPAALDENCLDLCSDTPLPGKEENETDISPTPVEITASKETRIEDNRIQVIKMQKTTPIINTDNKQILRVTTTATPEPESKPDIKTEADQVKQPSSCSSESLCELIPEKHRKPMVMTFVNRALNAYTAPEIKEAIAYTAGNVRGGSMQFKAYLDKTLKNKWAEGYLDSIPDQQELSWWEPGGFNGFSGRMPNGTITGSARTDSNLIACQQFIESYSRRAEA
ncbi:hypothetical protein [Desulfobacula toluolica]|uniref:Conserved uncharacterized protein n=1 Tax=Desulfobacula toluolica (strain DSM 7467 / Tol2) TaxID=651182 RepID=K0NP25_DESTT|nr:hypothetical protein [Desulfobacula toluolica]CCK82430.1 conserved uncharacterized protein [Desulfobacula toluolica Tol2]